MSVWDTMMGWISHDAGQRLYARIPSDHVSPAIKSEPLQSGAGYFRLWLESMSLQKDKEWFATWWPAVHSIVRFTFGDKQVEVPNLAGPQTLPGVGPENLDRVVPLNFRLTTLMPFNGGDVEIIAGLLAMQGTNYLQQFLKVMGDFAGLLSVPQLSSALSIVGPLASGVQTMLGGTNGQLRLGLHQGFSGAGGSASNELAAGYFVVMDADARTNGAGRLWVKDGQLQIGDALGSAQPVTGRAFMLFRLETRTERDDWDALTSISEPFRKAMDALGQGDVERARLLTRQAQGVAMGSPDLTRADRYRVATTIGQQFDDAKDILGKGATERGLPSLGAAMANASVSVDQWRNRGEPRFKPTDA